MWCAKQEIFDQSQPGRTFLLCRWHELFDEFTPDTFHPKLFNLPSLVEEAGSIAKLNGDHDAWGKHLTKVKEEIGERLVLGVEVEACTPRQLSMLKRLHLPTATAAEVEGLSRVLTLEGFKDHLEAKVREQFLALDLGTNAKKKFDASLIALATHAFQRGCSKEDCAGIGEMLGRTDDETREWILNSMPQRTAEFDCIIAVAATAEQRSTIRSVCERSGAAVTSPNIPGLPDTENVVFLRRKTTGLRSRDALEAYKEEVRINLNVLALYNQPEPFKIQPGGWTIEGDAAFRIEDRSPSFRNLHPRRNAPTMAAKAADALRHRDEPAILAALDLHNLALSMTDHRLRLVNLWSAMECLASVVETGGSIISRVENLVAPVLVWRKVDKVVRYLAMSIHFWLVENPEIDRARCPFGLGHRNSVAPEQLLKVLAEPKDSAGIRKLLDLVSGHPLLVYRINQAWELFHRPAGLSENLKQSERRLRWHLWRIYRARNLLVHQGITPPCLPQLADHLQHYFSWTLSRLLHGLTMGDGWTSRDSWHLWKSKSDHLMDSLPKNHFCLVLGDVFPEPVNNPDRCIWERATPVTAAEAGVVPPASESIAATTERLPEA